MSTTRELGGRAEALAARHLQEQGYRIVARNHRCEGGEIDLIAYEGDVLCFVEVRSRKTADYGDPLETISRQKIYRVARAARDYIDTLPRPWPEMRFDAVGILMS
ncbi:MAG: YraN family protein, partial [Deltaproteobacteria bacterium]|nr:YraN family protein [Deltaproteobacteria bacterium]